MLEVVDPQVLSVVRPFLVALYLLWAGLWSLVALHYGRAAYISWRLAGGVWSRALIDVTSPFGWGLRDFLCRLRLFRGAPFCGVEIPTIYQRGHLLRFAIFVGSLTPIVWGLYFVDLDRSRYTSLDVLVNLLFVGLSMMAAGAHLFLAYRARPSKWSRLVGLSVTWLLVVPALVYVLGL